MRCFRSADRRFRVEIRRNVWAAIETACARDFPDETGGILIGYYTADLTTAVVTDVTEPPPDSRRGRTSFDRGTVGLGGMLGRLWRRPAADRRYYLGEWHLHPCGAARPSGTDDRQMSTIAGAADHRCPEPVLLIVAGTPATLWEVGCWVYPRGRRITLSKESAGDEPLRRREGGAVRPEAGRARGLRSSREEGRERAGRVRGSGNAKDD